MAQCLAAANNKLGSADEEDSQEAQHRRADLLHQWKTEKCLDLAFAFGHPLLTDPFGDPLNLLLRNCQAGQLREGLAALAEGWVLDQGLRMTIANPG